MHKKLYHLQEKLEERDLPEYLSFLPPELRNCDTKLDKLYTDHILPIISNDTSLLPLLHSYTNIPLECDLDEIELLLKIIIQLHLHFLKLVPNKITVVDLKQHQKNNLQD